MTLQGKNVLLGITGGIAAYKILELIRLYKKNGANVKVILTPNALNFITLLTVKTLSNNQVYVEQFETKNLSPEHISLCEWGDVFVLAPASANTISKIATGVCDNLLTSLICAFKKTVILAPAMNCGMWSNEFVQENITKLEQRGWVILPPEKGFLACGTEGTGRLCKIEKIFDKTLEIMESGKFLKGKKIVITAGGTRENIDPVRFIGNYSSGKMGIALADFAYDNGAKVVLVNTFGHSAKYKCINTPNALEMQKTLKKEAKNADCVIMAAAVADYRAKEIQKNKIKKENNETLSIELTKNPDILKELCENKGKTLVVGFCAESENLIENAKNKIQNKGCDFIVANDISRSDIGFSANENEVYIIDKNLNTTKINKAAKSEIAKKILELIYG